MSKRQSRRTAPEGRIPLSHFLPFFEVKGENLPRLARPSPEESAAEGPAVTNWPLRAAVMKWSSHYLKSALKDQTEVQIPAAIRRLKDSAGQFQGGI